jgi:GNAT superfamily N-acetyltransferase
MRSRHQAMSFEEFERMPRELGWKYEYWNGEAHVSPGHQVVVATVPTAPRPVMSPCALRPPRPADEAGLIAAYLLAFGGTIEYCDWYPEKIVESARESVGRYLSGKRGRPSPASRVAGVSEPGSQEETLVGAVLLLDAGPDEARLDMLFVVPEWHRQGLATALVGSAINALHADGIGTLESAYVLGNAPSRAWHRKFGFTELPDLMLARHYWRYFEGEYRRLEMIGESSAEELGALARQREYWKKRSEELEKIADEQGFEAVTPFLRRR